METMPWEQKRQYGKNFQQEFKGKALIQCHSFNQCKINIIDLRTLHIRPLTQVEFNAFYLLPLDYYLSLVVFGYRKRSKIPLQLCYQQVKSSEPVTVTTMSISVKEMAKEMHSAFPDDVICGNAQLTFINEDDCLSEDAMHQVFLKIKAWSYHV